MTEADMIEWAEARRVRLRQALDDLGRRMGAEGYIDDVTEVDRILKNHGFVAVDIKTSDEQPPSWTFEHQWDVKLMLEGPR